MTEPRIAVCFAGLPRLTAATESTWKRFVERYDADVFVHTWLSSPSERSSVNERICNALHPKQMMTEPVRAFNTARFDERIWPHRSQPGNVLSMWYSISESMRLCRESGTSYDVICRARFDWWCPNLEIELSNGLTVPDDPGLSGHHFTYKGQPFVGHNDQFGYGSPEIMDIYSSTFDRIPWLYSDDGVDFCSELFLTANMISAGIRVNHQKNLTYRILR